MRLAPAVFATVLLALLLALWPELEQPGRTVRESLLLVAVPLLLGLSAVSPRRRVSAMLWAPLILAALAGLFGMGRAPSGETLPVARDLLLLAEFWILALVAAMLPAEPGPLGAARGVSPVASLGLALLGAAGILQAWFGWEALPQAAAPAATFVNRNVAAQTVVALLPLAAGGIVAGTSRRARWGAGLATGSGLAFLVATRSRGAWLAVVVGCAIGLVAVARSGESPLGRPPWRRVAGPVLFAAALLVAALVAPIADHDKGSVGNTMRSFAEPATGSGAIRLAFWRNGLEIVRDEPLLGVGPGRFAVVYPLYHRARTRTPGFGAELQVEHAHNDLLEFAINLGVPASIALLYVFLGAVYRSCRAASRAGSRGERIESAARAAALVGILVHGLVSFPVHSPASGFLAWFLVGRAWAIGEPEPGTPKARAAILAIAGALAIVGAWVGARELRSNRALSGALHAHASGACEAASKAAAHARRLAPWRRRESGMAAMIRFECERDARGSLEFLEPALAMQPNNLNLLLATGARRLKSGDGPGAERAFRRTVHISPSLGRGWLGLAMSLDVEGEHGDAAAACREAIDRSPELRAARLFCEGNRYWSP